MKKTWVGLVIWLCLASLPALGQQSVWTVPLPATTTGGNVSTTVAVTNTFQLVFPSATRAPGSLSGAAGGSSRHGCTIINQGTNNMWVTEGLGAASSTKALAVVLPPNSPYYCNWNGVVLSGEVDITGTAGDSFYASQE